MRTTRQRSSSFVRGAMTRRSFALWCGIAACGLAVPSVSSCARKGEGESLQTADRYLFDGTYVSVSADCAREAVVEALDLCAHYDWTLSRTNPEGDIGRLNEGAGGNVSIESDTAIILSKAVDYAEKTQGAFDVTVGAVSQLWDFREGVKPSDEEISEALRHVGYGGLSVDVGSCIARLDDPFAVVDLGGIAKGFIADKIASFLRDEGCESAMIDLGGNLYGLGTKPDGRRWVVGVSNPQSEDGGIAARLEIEDASVVTSGIYERRFEQDGIVYHHVLDPKTGYPVETDLLSVTVVSPSSMDADVYATWALSLGHDAARGALEDLGLEALLLAKDGGRTLVGGIGNRMA